MKVISLYNNEKKLIDKACKGDRRAQKSIYDKHSAIMLGVCRQYIQSLETAEDLMLNGFYKVFIQLETFNHSGNFQGWIRKIMVRTCLDYLRKKEEYKWSQPVDDKIITLENETDNCDEDDLPLAQLQEMIDSLPVGYKTVFNMYVLDGFKHNEIAALCSISVNTSKTQLRKARLMLQELIMENRKKHYEVK